ncbi:hypothetical protein KFE96_15000 [Kordiimonas sp. SCSIO 12603]|uniref:c-type cytochrome n=1 Tax=Kordiimonas sp. SCSIO 12603 TaxID=2829596 RepID=UPI00210417D8|nr:hypothetical protein [Kordiimonas sp. SCSIO 12603]UTW58113.1 hypothetical protein KFE96_15000 [Kordiimonas sp. SCSIO 12603]
MKSRWVAFIITLSLLSGAVNSSDKAEKLYRHCLNCHESNDPRQYATAPSLEGIIGRDIASIKGFDYSERLLSEEGVWTAEKLNVFLTRPSKAQPGTKMHFRGFRNPRDREVLIAWLAGEEISDLENPEALSEVELFRPCKVCHSYQPNVPAKIAPNLYGIYGRKIASFPNFQYSEQLLAWDDIWNDNTLNAFFVEFKGLRQGSHAAFRALTKEEDRLRLIGFLKSISPQVLEQNQEDYLQPDIMETAPETR